MNTSSGMDPRQRRLAMVATMTATVMQVIYTSLVTVALPTIQGELGASPDQGGWVLTSFLVTSAICMPLTGYFTDRLGMKRFLMISIVGFGSFTVLCGLAMSLGQLVTVRAVQGMFGAAMVPLSQAIIIYISPMEERAKAMAIWGLGVSLGPVIAPTLGGWVTDLLGWRWLFFMTAPVAILAFVMTARYVPDSPRTARTMDWLGLALLSAAVGGLQYTLDRGGRADWFEAREIQMSTAIGVVGLVGYVLHSLSGKVRPVFSLGLFRDGNFLTCNILMAALGIGMFGALVLQPILLQNLLGYPTATAGLYMMPRGAAMAVAIMIAGRLLGRGADPKMLVATGIILGASGSYVMTWYFLGIDSKWVIMPSLLQGLGLGLVATPMSTLAFATLRRDQAPEAAGVFSLIRTIGSSVAISASVTLFTRQAQVNWNQLGGHVNVYSPDVANYLQATQLGIQDPRALALVAGEVARQSAMIAMVDAAQYVTWGFLIMLPFILMIRGQKAVVAG